MTLYVVKFEDSVTIYYSHPLVPDIGYPVLTLKKGGKLESFLDLLIECEDLFEKEIDLNELKCLQEIGEI